MEAPDVQERAVSQAPPTPHTLRLIHCAFVLAVPLCALIHAYGPPKRPDFATRLPPLTDSPKAWGVLLISLLLIPAGFLLPKHLVDEDAPGGASSDGTPVASLMRRGTSLVVLSDVCFETIAICGIVGPALGVPPVVGHAQMALSFVLLLMNTAQVVRVVAEHRELLGRNGTSPLT